MEQKEENAHVEENAQRVSVAGSNEQPQPATGAPSSLVVDSGATTGGIDDVAPAGAAAPTVSSSLLLQLMGRPVSPRSDTNAKANAEAASQTVAAGAPPPGGEVAKLIATIEQEKRTDEKKEETEAATQDRTMEAQPQTSSSPQQTPSITQKPIVKLPLAGVTQRREEWLKKEEEVKQKQLNPHPPPLLSPRKDREERLSARSAGTTPSPALATFLAATSGGAVTPRSSGATPSPALSTTPATTSGGAVTPRSSGAASSAAAPPVSPSSSSAASAGERLAKEWERRLGEVAELREAKERAVAELKKDKDFLRTEMERLTITLNVTRRQKEWREKEMGVVKERLSEREGTLKRREVELDIAKRQLEDRETKLRAKEAELGRLQSERREEKELWEVRERQLAERLRDHERTVEGVKEEASGRDREIEERDEDLERMRQMLMDHLHQLNATQEANQALTSQLAARSQAQVRITLLHSSFFILSIMTNTEVCRSWWNARSTNCKRSWARRRPS
jgi:DNA repair exonuclease SbcCD ATPase subunit